jgi:hypothetical protein
VPQAPNMSRGVVALSNGVPSKGVRIASATALLLAERPGDRLAQPIECVTKPS